MKYSRLMGRSRRTNGSSTRSARSTDSAPARRWSAARRAWGVASRTRWKSTSLPRPMSYVTATWMAPVRSQASNSTCVPVHMSTSTPGCRSRKERTRAGTTIGDTVTREPTTSRPEDTDATSDIRPSISATRARTERASESSTSPSGRRLTPLPRWRTNSVRPRVASRSRSDVDMAGWERPMAAAAPVTEPCSARATKCSSSRRVTLRAIPQ